MTLRNTALGVGFFAIVAILLFALYGLAESVIAKLIVVGLFVVCVSIGADCWSMRLVPSIVILGVVSSTLTVLVFAAGLAAHLPGATRVAARGWSDAPFLALIVFLCGLAVRYAERRRLMPRSR